MRLIILFLTFLLLGISFACKNAAAPELKKVETAKSTPTTSTQSNEHNHAEDVNIPRITLADAKKEFDAGTAVFVDTRDISSYRFARIKGAIHLPAEAASVRWKEIPTDKKIIAYCSWRDEHTSAGLVQILNKNGITNAFALIGGTQAWMTADYPMDKAQ